MTAEPIAPDSELRASPMELFFDLVFVFTITQLTASLTDHLTPGGVVRVLVMLVVIWWMYDAFIWLTNAMPPATHPRRALMLTAMAGFLVISLAVPHAFEGSGAAFGWAYLVVVAVHTGMFAGAGVAGAAVLRMGLANLVDATLVVIGGYLQGAAQLGLWAAAFGLQLAIPYVVDLPRFHLRADHFVERHGLVVIIAFGESVIALGMGAGDLPELTVIPVLAALCALVVCVGLWWAYFGHDDDERAVTHLAVLDDARRNRLAIRVYNLGHYLLLFAVILLATGAEGAVAHPTGHLSAARASVLAAGPALFLLVNADSRRIFGLRPAAPRLTASAAVLATVPLGTGTVAIAQLASIAAVLALTFGWEERRSVRRPGGRG